MNIGICGTGTIASWVSDILCQLGDENIVLYTCATSPGFDCEEFAKKYGYKKISASFDDLMNDPAVDVVYIAVPNNFHYDLAKKALAAGKNLVVEKPMFVREEETKEIIALAREKGLFISEALWPQFLPGHKMINDVIASGEIGDLVSGEIIQLGNVMFLERVKHLETGGGEMLDEGPYALGFMVCHFGTDIDTVESRTRKLDTGVDAEDEIVVKYKNGVVVRLHQRMDTPREEGKQHCEIVGTKGKICVRGTGALRSFQIQDLEGNVIREVEVPQSPYKFSGMPPVSGYEYEWQGFEKALREGKLECEESCHAKSLAISRVITEVHRNAGIVFPF